MIPATTTSCFEEKGILDWVKDKRWLTALTKAADDPTLRFINGNCVVGANILPGVTVAMTHSMIKRAKVSKKSWSIRTPRKTSTVYKPRERRDARLRELNDMWMGSRRGTEVHHQLGLAVRYGLAAFRSRVGGDGVHKFTESILHALAQKGWRLVRSEYIAYDAALGISAHVDLVAVDESGRLIFIEIKTGYAGGKFERLTNRQIWTIPPFHGRIDFPCTVRNKAVVQIGLGAMMAAKRLRLPPEAYRAVVMQIEERLLRIIPLHRTFIQGDLSVLYSHLSLTTTRTRKSWAKSGEKMSEAAENLDDDDYDGDDDYKDKDYGELSASE